MASENTKPSVPEGYVPPTKWEFQAQGGTFGAMNLPTAGPRSDKVLPVGEHPIQLHSLATPNGQKVTILLEELGIEYDAWKTNIMECEQFGSEFVEMNPNSKIPAMLDRDFDPPLRVFESCNILKYLAEKHGKFIPSDPRKKVECFNWLFWQCGAAPYIGGGFGHFVVYAPVNIEYAIDRFTMETKRQLDVLNLHLADKDFLCGDEYSIADMAVFPWINWLRFGYKKAEFLDLDSYPHVEAWCQRQRERRAVKRGLRVNSWGDDGVAERHSAADLD